MYNTMCIQIFIQCLQLEISGKNSRIIVSFSPVLIDFCNNHSYLSMDWEEGLVLFFVGFYLVFRRILFYLLCIKSAV